MSVLIKDMDLPKSCNDCRLKQLSFTEWSGEDWYCKAVDRVHSNTHIGHGGLYPDTKPDWCPLTEAKDHKNSKVKVGDYVYLPELNDWGDILTFKVISTGKDKNGRFFRVNDEDQYPIYFEDIGRCVFTSESEARRAMIGG